MVLGGWEAKSVMREPVSFQSWALDNNTAVLFQHAAEVHTVANGQQHRLHARVARELAVQAVNCAAIGMFDAALFAQPPAPEHVVEKYQSIPAHARQYKFVISVVTGFVRVNERKIKPASALQFFQ